MDTYFDRTKKIAFSEMNSFNQIYGEETNCSICKGKGYVMEVIQEMGGFYTAVRECDCMAHKIADTQAKNNGTSPLLQKTFNNFYARKDWQKNIKELAIENAKVKDWFFIGGQSGAGKTHICSAITNYQAMNNAKVKYMMWNEDINKLKDFEDTSYMKELKRVECLYIDDLFKKPLGSNGFPNLTSSDIEKTWELLNFRELNKLKTVISSELTLDKILKIDESLGGRIKQNAGKFIISLNHDQERNRRLA